MAVLLVQYHRCLYVSNLFENPGHPSNAVVSSYFAFNSGSKRSRILIKILGLESSFSRLILRVTASKFRKFARNAFSDFVLLLTSFVAVSSCRTAWFKTSEGSPYSSSSIIQTIFRACHGFLSTDALFMLFHTLSSTELATFWSKVCGSLSHSSS